MNTPTPLDHCTALITVRSHLCSSLRCYSLDRSSTMVDHSGTKENELCVVALIGKSALFDQQANKSWKFNQLIQMPAFEQDQTNGKNNEDLEYFYDHLNNTIYVHLRSFHDTYQLLHMINDLREDASVQNFGQLWENKQTNFIKKCLICFLLSHIVIVRRTNDAR